MTTIAAGPLSGMLQGLVDARLDTIDRMLLGRVDRQDRLAIVREVESQIFDLLQGRDPDTTDRDDVLAILARLDPPEAYLPDESSGEVGPARAPVAPRVGRPSNPSNPRVAVAGGILGIASLVLLFFSVVGVFTEGFGLPTSLAILLIYGPVFLTFAASLLAIVFASWVRLRGGWAITGLVTGILSQGLLGFGVLYYLLTV